MHGLSYQGAVCRGVVCGPHMFNCHCAHTVVHIAGVPMLSPTHQAVSKHSTHAYMLIHASRRVSSSIAQGFIWGLSGVYLGFTWGLHECMPICSQMHVCKLFCRVYLGFI